MGTMLSIVTGNPLPPACSQHLSSPPGGESLNCHYGQTRDTCGNVVCMKGPGEMCGGKYGRYGICADGLKCSNCNRCQGCSFTSFICWNEGTCIWENTQMCSKGHSQKKIPR